MRINNRSVLHRDPTGDELYHCLKVLKVEKAIYKETLTLFRSQDYIARKTSNREFIRDAYQSLLGREPYRSETLVLELQLRAKVSRMSILGLVVATSEHQDIMKKTAPPPRL